MPTQRLGRVGYNCYNLCEFARWVLYQKNYDRLSSVEARKLCLGTLSRCMEDMYPDSKSAENERKSHHGRRSSLLSEHPDISHSKNVRGH